ncbi:MAG: sigma-70 family RNA polymerase sigma factor [Oscillospiraceae bacterium]|nr:sigma-70 family RNA polymerase sigma factor [Oscillospiraceae bacterium]
MNDTKAAELRFDRGERGAEIIPIKEKLIMDDKEIVELLYNRDERGVKAAQDKFSKLVKNICRGILRSSEEAEQCANDTLLRLWEAIPPDRPENLTGYVCKIARRLTLNQLRYDTAQMRNSDLLTELDECIPSNCSVEKQAELSELTEVLNEWLRSLPEKQQRLFTLRYFYAYGVKEAAEVCGMSKTATTTALMRLRNSLKQYLTEKGVYYD